MKMCNFFVFGMRNEQKKGDFQLRMTRIKLIFEFDAPITPIIII